MDVSASTMVQFPIQGSLLDSKKGSIGNRTECAARQALNKAQSVAETAALVGASTLGFAGINKYATGKVFGWNTKINDALKKGLKKIAEELKITREYSSFVKSKGAKIKINKIAKDYKNLSKGRKFVANLGEKLTNGITTVLEKLSKTTGKQKLMMGFGALAALTLLHKIEKHAFKSGQIDQKYNDRANAQRLAV